MNNIKFKKMHALGNDFVILEKNLLVRNLKKEEIIAICNRRTGIGCDQLVIMEENTTDKNDIKCLVSFFNPDGSESSSCGNASRCISWLLMDKYNIKKITLITNHTSLECSYYKEKEVTVNMGQIDTKLKEISLTNLEDSFKKDSEKINSSISLIEKRKKIANNLYNLNKSNTPINMFFVNIGNPHLVCFIKDYEILTDNYSAFNFEDFGSVTEVTNIFENRTNIELAYIASKNTIFVRVWERGTGMTMACGSGACAVAITAFKNNLVDAKVKIVFLFKKEDVFLSNTLYIEISKDNSILMTGPVAEVSEGYIKQDVFTKGINNMLNNDQL